MTISGSYDLDVPAERAYRLLQDPAVLAQCMPGCEELNKVGDDEYEMKMKLAVASLSGAFTGKVRLADQNPPESFRLIVEGNGKIGFMKGDGLMNISTRDAGSTVAYQGDVTVGGTIASVGQRLVETSAKMIIKRFFSKFESIAKESAG
mgnify:CR=1 FL=1